MDKSDDYIEMCKRAEEIQELRKNKDMVIPGDWFAFDDTVVPVVNGGYRYGEKAWIIEYQTGWECEDDIDFLPNVRVWIPRQDQLQEMLPQTDVYRLFNKLGAFGERTGNERTPEELVLKYVMKMLYSKTWDGVEWIKSEA